MIKDLVASFEKAKQQFPTIVQDTYKLKEGLYVRLNPYQSWDEQFSEIKRNHLIIRAKEDEPTRVDLLQWFKQRDYWSSTLDSNKSVDGKKQVHSCHPFALFMKRDVFLEEKIGNKYSLSANIDRFLMATQANQIKDNWERLLPGKKKHTDALLFFGQSAYAPALDYLDSPERLQGIERVAAWYADYVGPLVNWVKGLAFKNYIKLFFSLDDPAASTPQACERLYGYEYDLYVIPKIYNSNDYNQLVDEQLVGLPSNDMTMNSKKPFMEHTTMCIQAPDRVPLQQALLAKEATEWLASSKPKYRMNKLGYETGFVPGTNRSNLEGALHIYMDGTYNELHSFENVPFPTSVSVEVDWMNFLQLRREGKDQSKDDERELIYYDPIRHVEVLQKEISSRFFRGRMHQEFLFQTPDVKTKEFTGVMLALFLQSRQGFHDWFTKGTSISLRGQFAKVTLRLIEEQLKFTELSRMYVLADTMNLRLSIDKMFHEGGVSMAGRVLNILSTLREKLAAEEVAECQSDEEFYVLAGQLARYLLSLSEAGNKTGSIYEPFLRSRNSSQLKRQVSDSYMLYKHKIRFEFRKFNTAMSIVMSYELEQEQIGDMYELLLAGLFAENLFYEKSDKDKGERTDG
ncbi:hypothetical protein GK047_17840 [Paenibacillus sp. SYP-B3998]|uniref:Type I-B CRISPR-associated protein Cas8b/Csh1 n=1 Tax=Paenibacillus sp. SYP-B3998 TaxID=2678564 RepID=A0A6G4A0G7_9BACL|nr:hypothetical protein [Paenibacillus sp. SYP-B3998]NEW07865.1 hypothetical protein [Paenibacillus sp. SYP-B3998]